MNLSRRSTAAGGVPVLVFFLVLLFSTTGCGLGEVSSAAPSSAAPEGQAIEPTISQSSPAAATPSPTATPLPTASRHAPVSTPQPQSIAPPTSVSPTPTPLTSPCSSEFCVYTDTFLFSRPIGPAGNKAVDGSYRFGSTQGGRRDAHHGVEFLNSSSTAVLAAADGIVVAAGDDAENLYGPYPNFYGNLVVLEHEVPQDKRGQFRCTPGSIFTLYAHLSEIHVVEGERIKAADEIGLVGMSGAATGSHLHFEVRLGENTYASVRNPEIWLVPAADSSTGPMGALAGSIIDKYDENISVENIVIQHLPDGPDQPPDFEVYTHTYEEEALIGQPPVGESFAIGDLPAGWYRISFSYYGLQRHLVQVFPGQMTVTSFVINNQ